MSEWYGDMELLDEEIAPEECAVALWEADVSELMAEHWEEMMAGPDDGEFERMEAMMEEALERQVKKEALEIAASMDWDWEEADVDAEAEMDEDPEGKNACYAPVYEVPEVDDDIPF